MRITPPAPANFRCDRLRDVINGKAGKAAALPKFSDMLALSKLGGQIMPRHCFTSPKSYLDYAPETSTYIT